MSLSVGIVGLPNVGKSTLFKALTKKEVDIANYPFCTIDPNVGVVKVPDERVDKLAALFQSAKVIPTIVEFVDIAGLVRGANKGEGLGNQFLSHIREVDAICQVVRCFDNSEIIHVDNSVDPIRDIETINTELTLKDLETVSKRLESIEKEVRAQKKEAVTQKAILQDLQQKMNEGMSAFAYVKANPDAKEVVSELQLLTGKPMIYLLNSAGNVGFKVIGKVDELGAKYVIMDVREESEVAGLTEGEAKELGLNPSKLPELIGIAYEALGLITFLTTGADETRAWTIKKGAVAPEAAGVIHTDFEDKFIKAMVIPWDKLLEAGTYSEATSKGWLRTEGKEYIVQDGDILEIKHG